MENKQSRRDGKSEEAGSVRLHVYMARSGIASRRKCEEIITQGRVQVNGKTVIKQGVQVTPDDVVTVDGKRLYQVKRMIYLALHKPRGYLCSNYDPEGRSLAIDLLRPAYTQRLFNVGRLDYLSSGLIFFTNDGEFAKAISHPSSAIEKEYLVETKKAVSPEFLEEYRAGIRVDDEVYHLKEYEIRNPRSIRLVLEEGKNREIRNVFHSRNISVKRVHRVRVGNVSLKGIAPGHFRSLTEYEVKWFFSHAKRGKG